VARDDAREKARICFPDIENKYEAQLEAYKVMSDDQLFDVSEVHVHVKPEDMPGRPLRRVMCERCGEHVQDMREIAQDGEVLCRACACGGYYALK
jgi:formylmethanofuran dehydrogenase subunit E